MRQVKTRWMDSPANPAFGAQIASAMAWWREAGVDCDFLDEPQAWLAEPEPAGEPAREARAPAAPVPPPQPAPIPVVPAIDRASLPASLPEFAAWWLAEPLLDNGRLTGRIAPRGAAGARLMILVPHPEREDAESLLSGPQGRLLDGMLAAMGVPAEEAYFASLLPRHTPHADWDAAKAAGIGEIAAHHVALVGPRMVISFCGNILPLPGNDPPNNSDTLRRFNHGDLSIPLLPERELSALIERPRWKGAFWRRWLDFAG